MCDCKTPLLWTTKKEEVGNEEIRSDERKITAWRCTIPIYKGRGEWGGRVGQDIEARAEREPVKNMTSLWAVPQNGVV